MPQFSFNSVLLKRNTTFSLFLIFCLLFSGYAQAKVSDVVDNKDALLYYLTKNKYSFDTTHPVAIILYEKGESYLGNHRLTYKITRTIKILEPTSASSLAKVTIPEVGKMHVSQIRGVTYNLVHGKVVKQKLENADIIKDRITKNATYVKFNLPSLKVGSIIHYSFKVSYNTLYGLPSWEFQHRVPTFLSEYSVSVPTWVYYTHLIRSRTPFTSYNHLNDMDADSVLAGTFKSNYGAKSSKSQIWIRRNIKAIRPAPFRKNEQFFTESIHFNLQTGSYYKWSVINELIFRNNSLYARAFNGNSFLKDKMKLVTKNDTTALEKAKSIFRFVRDSITVNNNLSGEDVNIRRVFVKRQGNSRDVNILLAAMLRRADLDAACMVLHTTSGLPLNPLAPSYGNINYIAVCLTINAKHYYLDATKNYLPFNMLPPKCYNGFSWVMNKDNGFGVNLSPNLLVNDNNSYVKLTLLPFDSIHLTLQKTLGKVLAFRFRSQCQNDEIKAKNLIKKGLNNGQFAINHITLKNLSNPDKPLKFKISLSKKMDSHPNKIYLNIFYDKFFNKNPFKVAKRQFPIHMSYIHKNSYVLVLKYPKSMTLLNKPKPFIGELQNKGMILKFNAMHYPSQHILSVRSSFEILKSDFPTSKYKYIQKIFSKLIQLQNNKVILKEKI